MTTNFNHFYDTYFKTKGSSGAISNGSSTYTLRCDGNTFLDGNLDVTTINTNSLTNLPNIVYIKQFNISISFNKYNFNWNKLQWFINGNNNSKY